MALGLRVTAMVGGVAVGPGLAVSPIEMGVRAATPTSARRDQQMESGQMSDKREWTDIEMRL